MGLIEYTQSKRDLITWNILSQPCKNEMIENTEKMVRDIEDTVRRCNI